MSKHAIPTTWTPAVVATTVTVGTIAAGLAAAIWIVWADATDDLGVTARTIGLSAVLVGIVIAAGVVVWAAHGLLRERRSQ